MVRVFDDDGRDLPEPRFAEHQLEVIGTGAARIFFACEDGGGEAHWCVGYQRIRGVVPKAKDIGFRFVAECTCRCAVDGEDADTAIDSERIEKLPLLDWVQGEGTRPQ